MDNTKLELRHLASYLPYGLHFINHHGTEYEMSTIAKDEKFKVWATEDSKFNDNRVTDKLNGRIHGFGHYLTQCKPLLQPLAAYKDINGKAVGELNCDVIDQMEICKFARRQISLHNLNYGAVQILLQNHVDIFGLIDNGLAIGAETLKTKK